MSVTLNESLLTKAQVCTILQISPTTLQRWLKEKIVEPVRIGGSVRFSPQEIQDLIKKK